MFYFQTVYKAINQYSFLLDINECQTLNGGCSQWCVDTVGSYECQCDVGQVLGADQRSCAGSVISFI